jgi:hypothetical protein
MIQSTEMLMPLASESSMQYPFVVLSSFVIISISVCVAWRAREVSALDKKAIHADATSTLIEWICRLTDRFQPQRGRAMRENMDLTFCIVDVKAQASVLVYFQSKMLRARAYGFESIHSQLEQVYVGIDVALWRDLFEPTSMTTIEQFRNLLAEKEELWIQLSIYVN